jgi:hypothetical protein
MRLFELADREEKNQARPLTYQSCFRSAFVCSGEHVQFLAAVWKRALVDVDLLQVYVNATRAPAKKHKFIFGRLSRLKSKGDEFWLQYEQKLNGFNLVNLNNFERSRLQHAVCMVEGQSIFFN